MDNEANFINGASEKELMTKAIAERRRKITEAIATAIGVSVPVTLGSTAITGVLSAILNTIDTYSSQDGKPYEEWSAEAGIQQESVM